MLKPTPLPNGTIPALTYPNLLIIIAVSKMHQKKMLISEAKMFFLVGTCMATLSWTDYAESKLQFSVRRCAASPPHDDGCRQPSEDQGEPNFSHTQLER